MSDRPSNQQPTATDRSLRSHLACDFGYLCHDCGDPATTFVTKPTPGQPTTDDPYVKAATEPFCDQCSEPYIQAGGREHPPVPTHGLPSGDQATLDTWSGHRGTTMLTYSVDRMAPEKGITGNVTGRHANRDPETPARDRALSAVVDLSHWE